MDLKSLVVVYSYHHKNTEKIANIIAGVLSCEVKYPDNVSCEEIQKYDLVGFGAGISGGKHYEPLLKFANSLQNVNNKKAFIFSTSGISNKEKMANDHLTLKNILISKGYIIISEYNCNGFDTFGEYEKIGGLSKGRPNENDFNEAKLFAKKLFEY